MFGNLRTNLFAIISVILLLVDSSASPFNMSTTWLGGASVSNQAGSSVVPSSRSRHGSFATASGTLYLYGGLSYTLYIIQDMWMFDATQLQWTLLRNGPRSTQTKGVESAQTFPGPLCAAACFMNSFNSLGYCTGGFSSVAYNDVWSFNTTTALWTWVYGSITTAGVASAQGVESQSNMPSSRYNHGAVSDAKSGHLYIFGGIVNHGKTSEIGNDLWRFNISSSLWTWMSGSLTALQPSVVSVKGSSSASDCPSSRKQCGLVSDNNCLYLFHGYGLAMSTTALGGVNDVWKYNITTGWWSWIAGGGQSSTSITLNTYEVGASLNTYNSSYTPGAMDGAFYSYYASHSLVTVFGGIGYDVSGTIAYKNTLWVFNISSFQWLLSSNKGSRYRTVNMTDDSSFPYPRIAGSASFAEALNSMLVFGGTDDAPTPTNTGYKNAYNDVWRFQFIFPTASQILTQTSNTTVVISSLTTSLTSTTSIATSFFQNLTTTTISTSSTLLNASSNSTKPSSILYESTNTIFKTSAAPLNIQTSTTATTTTTPFNIQTSQTGSDSSNTSLGINRNLWSLILAASGFVVLISAIVTCYCCLTCRKKQRNTDSKFTHHTDLESDADLLGTQMSNIATTNGVTYTAGNGATQLAQQTEFAVPGYLQFTADQDFSIEDVLARGGAAEIYKAVSTSSALKAEGDLIAFKIVGPSRDELDSEHVQQFEQELAVHHYLGRHRNIADLLGWCECPLGMLLKLYPRGSLFTRINRHEVPHRWQQLQFALDISHGLQYMHSKEVAHCDIKPGNILIDIDVQTRQQFCVLTDFGISQMYSKTSNLVHAFRVINMGGLSLNYAAPELFVKLRKGITSTGVEEAFAVDLYAFSIVLKDLLKNEIS